MKTPFKFSAAILIGFRVIQVLANPLTALIGYGDLGNFFRLAQIPGWPYLHFWSEYPPLFPFFSKIIFFLAGGKETVYVYALLLILTLADILNLYLFMRLCEKIWPGQTQWSRYVAYLSIMLALPYSWWYFEPMVVSTILAALLWVLEGKYLRVGWMVGLGILTKLFPAFLLPVAFKKLGWKRGFVSTLIALGLVLVIYAGLWLASPEFTRASVQTQGTRSSWETVWALIDGNYDTGKMGPLIERLDPQAVSNSIGKSAVFPSWISLLIFGGVGFVLFIKFRAQNERQIVGFALMTLGIFFLWSPGWSPQWELYLLPLILLVLPPRKAVMIGFSLILINLVEWPLILTQGKIQLLPVTVGLRTFLLFLMSFLGYQISFGKLEERSYKSGLRSENTGM